MSRKIARITNDKKLLLGNEVVEDNTKIRLDSDGRLDTDEIIEYPAELEGGRNLLGNTAFNKPPETWTSNITVNKGEPNSVLVEKDYDSTFGLITKRNTKIIAGDVYTLSFELKTTNVSRLTYNYLMDDDEGNWTAGIPEFDLITDGKWHFYSATFTSRVNRTNCGLMLAGDTRVVAGANNFEVRKIKLEKGTKATPWTPAPEDLGLNYPDSIQNFNSSISVNNIIVPEFIEGYPFVKPVIDDSLVLWLDGSTGNNYEKTNIWKDLSGNGNDGELRNFGYTEDSGWVDGGLKFDGVDDTVEIPKECINEDEDFTIEILAESSNWVSAKALLNKTSRSSTIWNEKGFGVTNIYNPHYLYVSINDGVEQKFFKINSVDTYDNSSIVIKKEGTMLYTFFNNGKIEYDISEFGSFRIDNNIKISQGYDSNIKLIRIYNRALTDEEILQNYQAGQCSPLLAMRGDVIG